MPLALAAQESVDVFFRKHDAVTFSGSLASVTVAFTVCLPEFPELAAELPHGLVREPPPLLLGLAILEVQVCGHVGIVHAN